MITEKLSVQCHTDTVAFFNYTFQESKQQKWNAKCFARTLSGFSLLLHLIHLEKCIYRKCGMYKESNCLKDKNKILLCV